MYLGKSHSSAVPPPLTLPPASSAGGVAPLTPTEPRWLAVNRPGAAALARGLGKNRSLISLDFRHNRYESEKMGLLKDAIQGREPFRVYANTLSVDPQPTEDGVCAE